MKTLSIKLLKFWNIRFCDIFLHDEDHSLRLKHLTNVAINLVNSRNVFKLNISIYRMLFNRSTNTKHWLN